MKRIISAILTVSIVFGASTTAFADRKLGNSKLPNIKNESVKTLASNKDNQKKAEKGKAEDKKNAVLEKTKNELIKKCDQLIAQINKLKSYIISRDGKFLVEFKDQTTGDAALKSIDQAIAKIEVFKKSITDAKTSKELKDISKEIQKNLTKHQAIVKRITGLTSAARLKKAYDSTKALADKLKAGIDGISSDRIRVDVNSMKKELDKIEAKLEKAKKDYLEAIAKFSSINDTSKNDKSFKEAQSKLMEAKKGLQEALTGIKRLLVKIKTSVHKPVANVPKKHDDDKEDD